MFRHEAEAFQAQLVNLVCTSEGEQKDAYVAQLNSRRKAGIAKEVKINLYAKLRLRLERGQYSCEEEMWRLVSQVQDLANELGLS